jgi:hypothetical protein
MMLPLWLPFAMPFFVAAVIADKLTGGAISKALQHSHDEAVRAQFHWEKRDE